METQNKLLAALPTGIRGRLAESWQIVDLKRGHILHFPGQEIQNVYFPLDCLISITVTMGEGRTVEAGIVGSREMVGVNAFMGGRETNQTEYVCQSPGTAIKVEASLFLDEFNSDKTVRDVMLKFTQAYIPQLSQNVACNRLHSIEQRFARWMLECRDRLKTDDVSMTHEFISEMLGVRRAGITEVAGKLQERNLIESARGTLRVIDSDGLKATSCECFGMLLDEYDRLLGPAIKQHGSAISKP